ncbi:MAG TPA: hypothetical protein VM344_10415, partial [Vitreimonas sp.]|nr:hypothetical protein [Vitreimonas sp.]
MPEILTESFCERCGSRYTFESAAPGGRGIGRFKTLSKGLKNFVMSDDQSFDEAFAAARSDLERQAIAQQLDAFHKAFNFCMTCRQYTCSNCWNREEGRCLTCAPQLGHEILPAAFAPVESIGNGASTTAPRPEELAWPTVDLRPADAEPRATEGATEEDGWSEADMPEDVLAGRLAALGIEPAATDADDAGHEVSRELAPEAEAVTEPEPEAVVAEAEPEPEAVVAEAEPEPEAVVAEAEPEPEAVVAEAEPEPEAVVAEAEPEP